MPDEDQLFLRPANPPRSDRARDDLYGLRDDLGFIKAQLAQLRRRTRASEGARVTLGRKRKLTLHQQCEAIQRHDQGESVREIARSYNVNPSSIFRLTA
jgi:helix-turn-helix resolvase-like protein